MSYGTGPDHRAGSGDCPDRDVEAGMNLGITWCRTRTERGQRAVHTEIYDSEGRGPGRRCGSSEPSRVSGQEVYIGRIG